MTPEYASPEQLRDEPVGVASDVYAFGVVLTRLLTGARPIRRRAAQLARLVSEHAPERPSTRASRPRRARARTGNCRTGLRATRRRCAAGCQTSRQHRAEGDAQRIPRAATRRGMFADDLKRYLAGQPVSARPDSFRYRAGSSPPQPRPGRRGRRRRARWVTGSRPQAARERERAPPLERRLHDVHELALAALRRERRDRRPARRDRRAS